MIGNYSTPTFQASLNVRHHGSGKVQALEELDLGRHQSLKDQACQTANNIQSNAHAKLCYNQTTKQASKQRNPFNSIAHNVRRPCVRLMVHSSYPSVQPAI